MRILNIYFKNINSLEGEGRVDFDQSPLAESGVFAITGPNGSGKSSILDVITLGMYGETFRFDKPAEHIITKHTDESFAQVEFAFAGETYRSSWHAKRSDSLRPEMTLSRLNGEQAVLAESPVLVRKYLAELTGMDFHKFSKSIVLPQGDFAAFLNALDSERMDILEKISGSDLYADYQRQAEAKNAELKEKVAFLEKETDLIPVISAEELEATEHDLQDFTEINQDQKIQEDQLLQQFAELDAKTALESRHRQLLGKQQQLQEQIYRGQQDLQRIAIAASQATLFRDDLQALENQQTEAEQSRSSLNNYRTELNILQQQSAADDSGQDVSALLEGKSLLSQKKRIDELKLEISGIKLESPRENELAIAIRQQLDEKQTTLAEVDSWLQANQGEAILTSDFPDVVQLRNLRTELQELSGKLKSQGSWSKKAGAALKKNKEALAANQARLTELGKQIETDQNSLVEIAQGKSFDELKTLLQDQQSRLDDFQSLLELATVNARLSEKKGLFGWFGRSKAEEAPDESQIQTRIDALKLELSQDENISRTLDQAIANETLLKKMSSFRSKLVEGKPCYLCGSTLHPYVQKPPVLSDSKKALADQRGKTLVMKATLELAEKELAAAQRRNSQLTAKQKFLQEKRSEWQGLANRLNVARGGLEISNLSLQKELVREETEEFTKIKNLVNEHAQLQRDSAKAKDEIVLKKTEAEKLSTTVEELEAVWNNRSPDIIAAEQQYAQSQIAEKALTERLEKQLGKLGEKLPGKGKENLLFDRLNSRRQDYQIRELRQTGLREEIGSLKLQLQACQQKSAAYQDQFNDISQALSLEERIYLHLSVREKQAQTIIQEQLLAEQEQTATALRRVITEKIADKGFVDVEQLQDLLRLVDREAEIFQLIEQQTPQLAALDAEIFNLEAQLKIDNAELEPNLSKDDLLSMQNQLAKKIEITEQEIRSLQNKLDKQYGYRQKYETLDSELQELRKQLTESNAEIIQINDGQGGLRRKVQQLLTDKLLSETNRILEKISGRYYVRSAASEHGLALEIEDTKQKNVRRLPKTLSGGESFVVSLALALALAENANSGKAIESLFLDEGFGNLDAESLYLALSTLENLKIQGKTVGVISHVDAVKKRIKTQIELVKKANGLSELKMVA